MKKILVSLVAMMFLVVPMAFGALITDATANGENADYAYGPLVQAGKTNPSTEAGWINDWIFADTDNSMDNNFQAVAKFEYDEGAQEFGQSDWIFTVSETSDDGVWSYVLNAFAPMYVGATIDFALGVKQALGFSAYVWEAIQLDITGTFKSTFQGPAYSHVTAFVQNPTAQVPEPTTLLLFGAGIAGLALYRRKRS